MKKLILIGFLAFTCFANITFGQDVPQSQVPSVIVNNFQQKFPKALDQEWELEGEHYNVDFEIGLLRTDHSAWYTKEGKLIRHKEEISKSDLPQSVLATIKKDFNSFRVEDVKKITETDKASYTLDLKKLNEEWKVTIDEKGNVLSKVAD